MQNFTLFKTLSPLLLAYLLAFSAFGQSGKGTITGKILTADGQPAQFVSIQIKGTSQGTSTDESGNFTLKTNADKTTLLVSGVGFQAIEKEIETNQTNIEIQLQETAAKLGEITISGQRRRTSTATKMNVELRDIPMSVNIVGQELLQQQQIISMTDVVKNVSGVTQTGSYNGGYQYFNSRGFDMNNWTNFRRNGTLLWNMGNHFADFYENIEFLKGPAAILYGDVAPGGIMNFVTKKPLNYEYRRFDLKVGEYGLIRPSVDISGILNEKNTLKYRLNATYEQSKSFRDEVNNQTFMLAPVVQWDISPRLTWIAEANLKTDKRIGDPGVVSPDGTFEGLKKIKFGAFYGEKQATYTYNNTSLFSTLRYRLNNNWQIQNTLAYTLTERTPLNVYLNNDADAEGNITRYQYFFKQRFDTYTANLDLIGEVKTGNITHKIIIGADFVDDEIRLLGFLQESIPSTINLYNPQRGTENLFVLPENRESTAGYTTRVGVYAQDQMSLLDDKLQILLGFRYNHYNSGTRFDNEADEWDGYAPVKVNPLNPRLGVVFKPKTWLSIYGSYSQGYEVNGFDWIQPDLLLENTESEQVEFGIKGDILKERLGITLAVFNINKSNVYSWAYADEPPSIDYISWTPNDGSYFTYYAPQYRSRGIELDINGKITNNLNINANAAFIQAEIVEDPFAEKGNWLPNQPRESFSIWANYKFTQFLKGLEIGYGAFYKGKFYADILNEASNQTRSVLTMDASVAYQLKNVRFQANITNLTDERYWLGAYSTWEPQWVRRAILGVSVKF
jgi:iron complex outermembrane receptor protein